MNDNTKLKMLIETIMFDNFIKSFREGKAGLFVRELGIQNAKLRRMLAPKKEISRDMNRLVQLSTFVRARESKRLRKKQGRQAEAIGLQHKKVQKCLFEFLSNFEGSRNPPFTKAQVRALFKHLKTEINKRVIEIQAQLAYDPQKPRGPFSRIGAR